MNNAPINERLTERWSGGWVQWFASVVQALGGWRKTITANRSINFPSIAAQTQTSASVTITGARQGDSVMVAPYADVSGLSFSGVVTSNDTATIYAKNFTSGAIDPATQDFRITLFQNQG